MHPFKLKLIATDLDGTLLKEHRYITPENKAALLKAHNQGIKIVIATGRPYQLVKGIIEEVPFVETFILNNGAAVYHTLSQKNVFETPVKPDVLKEIIRYSETENVDFEVHTHDAIYVKGDKRLRFFSTMSKDLSENHQPNILDFNKNSLSTSATKMMLIEPDLHRYNQFKSHLDTFKEISVVQSQDSYIDINAQNISKGSALVTYVNSIGISSKQVMAIGDQENDRTMIQFAEVGVAMGDAIDELKVAANYITGKSDTNGVEEAILKYL